jgi:hypothetical protein
LCRNDEFSELKFFFIADCFHVLCLSARLETVERIFFPFLQIHSVDEFVCSVNSHLTTRQENERLKGIMARIESYDVVVGIAFKKNS